MTQQIPADANDVIDQLSQQIGALNKQIAILTSQLAAAMKLIPQDVLDSLDNSLDKEAANAED
nr:MAG TPA: lipoprotein [Caudoviricetes sp.]